MKLLHLRVPSAARRARQAGFSLVEVMIVVVIVGVLAAIALPSYSDYVTRGRILEATTALSNSRQLYEQFFLDNRTYVNGCASFQNQVNGQIQVTSGTADFFVGCVETASTYTVTATGQGVMANFTYTITNTGAKTSQGPGAWGGPVNCWLIRKGGLCE